MNNKHTLRALRALARAGLDVSRDGHLWCVRMIEAHNDVVADVLLPDDFPLEGKALAQLATLARAHHPSGGRVTRCCASPDFHPGDAGVAIGSIATMEGMVLPAAVGSDINCGMRLHVVDLDVDTFNARRKQFIDVLSGDLLLGTRDVPMTGAAFRAVFRDGLLGLLAHWHAHDDRAGHLVDVDLRTFERDLTRVFSQGTMAGDERHAPEDLLPVDGVVRDGGIGTIGGGNHFVEVQVVEEIVDRSLAYAWGVKRGAIAFMIHSGSRLVGKHIGNTWRDKARRAWPAHTAHPQEDMFSFSATSSPELVEQYLVAEATAANYGFFNRMVLAELVRRRIVDVFGERDAKLVYDLPHNITLRDGDGYVVRKGACPAHDGQPVIIPGSMGAPSFLGVGTGSATLLSSTSHGAGRAKARIAMSHVDEAALGLSGVTCVTLRDERRIEEAPAAYKPIEPVIDAQVAAGIMRVVAKLRPLLTFKG
jgi:tRNA-splicing ligase RtcB (3'-phosphate/5'-hydroxy nucleic acid ligase)